MKVNQKQLENEDISYETLKNLVESSLDIICNIDQYGRFIWLSSACERIWGYKRNELIGKKYLDFVAPADRRTTEYAAKQIMGGVNFTNFENRYVCKDGSIVPMVWSATWNVSKQTMLCIARDATEKVNAQLRLQENEMSLKEAMRIAKMGTWTYDASINKATWSEELFDLYGIKPNPSTDLVALFKSMVHQDDAPVIKQAFLDSASTAKTFTHRFVKADGQVIYVKQRISNKIIENWPCSQITGTTQDITDDIEQERQLLYREQRFSALLANNLDMVGIIDSVGNYSYVSENTEKLIGYNSEFLVGKNSFDFIHPEDAQVVFERFITLDKDVNELELPVFRFRSAAGDWRWIECKVTDKSKDPSIQGIIVNSRDVTSKKAAEDKLLSHSRITEDTPNAVVMSDVEGKITWVNKAFSMITEYSLNECAGTKPGHLLQGRDSNPVTIALMRQRLLERKPFEVEVINYNKRGKAYWINIQCQPQFDGQGKQVGFFAILTDITEKKNLQERLKAELEKRQMLITAEIVKAQEKERDEIGKELHDNVNQILSTVKLYLGMLKEPELNRDELISKSMCFVQDCIDEIRQISKRLSSPHHNDLNLNEAIEQLINSISINRNFNIAFKPYNLENCSASVDVQMAIYRIIQEHLTNIMKHAGATNVELSLACINNVLNLKIVDDGIGFDIHKKRKGIGISNIMNRAVAVNGKIDIRSTVGAGCCLHGSFPI